MRIKLPSLTPIVVSAAVLVGLGTTGAALSQTSPAPQASDGQYAWAGACKKCHEEIHAAWAATKHARALDRLSRDEQQQECVGCHVTGPKNRVEQDGKVVNAGVQCESCHGPGAAHVADPAAKTGLVRKPPEQVCVGCHNDRSPRFKGFLYSAMLDFSHRVGK